MLCDVISIRARRRAGGRIHYRVVDEYPEDHTFTFSPMSSAKPLTLGTIVELILTFRIEEEKDFPEGFLGTCLRFNTDHGAMPDEAPGFITAESLIYPHLDRPVGERLATWLEQTFPRPPEDEDEDFEEDVA